MYVQRVWELVPIFGEEWGRVFMFSVAVFVIVEVEKASFVLFQILLNSPLKNSFLRFYRSSDLDFFIRAWYQSPRQ